jgi:hypothetical protein
MLRSFTKQNLNESHTLVAASRTQVPTQMALAIAMAAIAALCCGGPVHAQCQYEVTAIIQGPPCPFGGHATLIGSGLNNHGEVVGRFRMCGSGQEDQAFYWSPTVPGGAVIPLPMPPGTAASRAYDINDHKQIVGEYRIPFEGWFGFMYDMKTVMSFITCRPSTTGAARSSTQSTTAASRPAHAQSASRVNCRIHPTR